MLISWAFRSRRAKAKMRRHKPGRFLRYFFLIFWTASAICFYVKEAQGIDYQGIGVILFYLGDWTFTFWLIVKVWHWLFRSAGRTMAEGAAKAQDATRR